MYHWYPELILDAWVLPCRAYGKRGLAMMCTILIKQNVSYLQSVVRLFQAQNDFFPEKPFPHYLSSWVQKLTIAFFTLQSRHEVGWCYDVIIVWIFETWNHCLTGFTCFINRFHSLLTGRLNELVRLIDLLLVQIFAMQRTGLSQRCNTECPLTLLQTYARHETERLPYWTLRIVTM